MGDRMRNTSGKIRGITIKTTRPGGYEGRGEISHERKTDKEVFEKTDRQTSIR